MPNETFDLNKHNYKFSFRYSPADGSKGAVQGIALAGIEKTNEQKYNWFIDVQPREGMIEEFEGALWAGMNSKETAWEAFKQLMKMFEVMGMPKTEIVEKD